MDQNVAELFEHLARTRPDDINESFDAFEPALTALKDSGEDPTAAAFAEKLTDTGQVNADFVEETKKYLEESDKDKEILDKLAEEGANLRAEYGHLAGGQAGQAGEPGQAGPEPDASAPKSWDELITKHAEGLKADYSNWDDFYSKFTTDADKCGVGPQAQQLFGDVSSLAAYGLVEKAGEVAATPGEAATLDKDVEKTFDAVMAKPEFKIPDEQADAVKQAFAQLVNKIPKAATLDADQIEALLTLMAERGAATPDGSPADETTPADETATAGAEEEGAGAEEAGAAAGAGA